MVCTVSPLIFSQSPPDGLSERDLGGKAWNLFRLQGAGFPVPPWCVLTARVFDEAVAGHRACIARILADIDFTDQSSIDGASCLIRELVLRAEINREIGLELETALERMPGDSSLFSVRSSVVGEDSAEHSFAGQMDSYLNVSATHVMDTVRRVWTSAFSSRALVYRHRTGLTLTEVSTAVIIQAMVQAAASGVLFTRELDSRADQCVICAGFGLGEGVVTDQVETDTYRIGWRSDNISKHGSIKTFRVVLDPIAGHGTVTEAIPEELGIRQVLTDSQVHGLRDVGVEVERRLGAPQDIEWAFDAGGNLLLLQARPIVFTARHAAGAAFRIWDNSNVVEGYPGMTLPLTFTFVREGYERAFAQFARKRVLAFPPFNSPLNARLHIFKNMIGLLDGRVYYNLLNWYEMLSFFPGFRRHKESWDRMIGIKHRIEFPQTTLPLFYRVWAAWITAWKLLSVRRTARRFFEHFGTVYQCFSGRDLAGADEHELVAIYEGLAQELTGKWSLTLDNDFAAMTYFDWLRSLCSSWELSRRLNLHNDLLCGEAGVESVEPVRSLVRLAELFRATPDLQVLMSEHDDLGVWSTVQREPANAALREALDRYLAQFGDRGLEELKLDRPSFREQPEQLIRLIRGYTQGELTDETMERHEQAIRSDAEQYVRENLKNPFKRLVFGFVVRNARLAVAYRENMRFARSRLFGIVRRLFRRMGELFAEKGLIVSAADIHFLTVEEVFGVVQGTAVTRNLKALVAIRRQEYAEFARRDLGERVQTIGIPYLNDLRGDAASGYVGNSARGTGCSSGIAEGISRVVSDPRRQLGEGDHILVAKCTDPGWVFLMIASKGIVVEKGSVLSHTAIIGRELGVPTIIGVKDATRRIPDGAKIIINGTTGELQWHTQNPVLPTTTAGAGNW